MGRSGYPTYLQSMRWKISFFFYFSRELVTSYMNMDEWHESNVNNKLVKILSRHLGADLDEIKW